MKKVKLLIFGLAILLVLFSGCSEMSREEKNLCYSLASKSYSYVPVCETERSCFEKVNEMFKTNLGYEQENKLYELKNYVGRSWFFYNKGLAELKKISSYCSSGSTSSLVASINQARYYFEEAFSNADNAMKKSTEIISFEENILAKEEIDLLKEEKLFDSLTEIRQILTELSTGKTNSGSYVSYYLEKVDSFKKSAASKGFNYLIEKESYIEPEKDFIEETFGPLINIPREIYLAPIRKAMDTIWGMAENYIFKVESITELKRIPASDLMLLYSNIVGNQNSALTRFSDLINKTSKNYEYLIEEKAKLLKENEVLLKSTKENILIYEKKTNYYSIIKKMSEKKIVEDFDPQKEVMGAEEAFFEVKREIAKNNISLGKALLSLKDIRQALLKVRDTTNTENSEIYDKMVSFCKNEANGAKDVIKDSPKELALISNNVSFYSTKVINTVGEESLEYCKKLLENMQDYLDGKENYAKLEARKIDSTSSCFRELEQIFNISELKELENEFEKIKQTKVNEDNIFYFEEACELIKKQAEAELSEYYSKKELINKYNYLAEKTEILNFVCKDIVCNDLSQITKDFAELKEAFERTNLIAMAKNKENIEPQINSLNSRVELLLKEKISFFVGKNTKIVIFPEDVPETNMEYSYYADIIITNPYSKLNLSGIERAEIRSDKTIYVDECINNIILGEKTTFTYECLNFGETKIRIWGKDILRTEEVEKLVYASNEKSVLHKEITAENKGIFAKVKIKTKALSEDYSLTYKDKELFGEKLNNDLFFYAENYNGETISIIFYLNNLVSSEFTLKETEPYDADARRIVYTFSSKNNYTKAIEANLFLPINKNISIESIEIIDEMGDLVNYNESGNRILLKKVKFLENETKTYEVIIHTGSNYEYYINLLNKYKQELDTIDNGPLLKRINLFVDSLPGKNFIKEAELLCTEAKNVISRKNEMLDLEKKNYLLVESLTQLKEKTMNYKKELIDLGITGAVQKVEEKLNSAEEALIKKEKLLLEKAISGLNGLTFDINKEMLAESEIILKEIKSIKSENPKLKQLVLDAIEKKQVFERLMIVDPAGAKRTFSELVSVKAEFDKLYLQIHSSNKTNEKIDYLANESRWFIEFLKKELSVEESLLVNSKLIKPITLSRLDSLAKKIEDVINEDTLSEDKEEKLTEIRGELKSAVDSLKRQTINLFNGSIDGKKDEKLLGEAKNYIDSNKYVAAFLILSEKGTLGDNIPFMSFIPIVLLVVAALAFKKFSKKSEENTRETKKEIEADWEKG